MADDDSPWWFGVVAGAPALLPAFFVWNYDRTLLDEMVNLAGTGSSGGGTKNGGGFTIEAVDPTFVVAVDVLFWGLLFLGTVVLAVSLFLDADSTDMFTEHPWIRPSTLGIAGLVPIVGSLIGLLYLVFRGSAHGFSGVNTDRQLDRNQARDGRWWAIAVVTAAFVTVLGVVVFATPWGITYGSFKFGVLPFLLPYALTMAVIPLYVDAQRLTKADCAWRPSPHGWSAAEFLLFPLAAPIAFIYTALRWWHVGVA